MKKYILKLKWYFIAGLSLSAFYSIIMAFCPYLIKLLIDYDFSKGTKGVVLLIATYILITAVGSLSQYILQCIAWKQDKKLLMMVKQDIFKSLLSLSYDEFNKDNINDYVSMLDNDVPELQSFISLFIETFDCIFLFISYSVLLFALNPIVALALISCSVLSLFLPNITAKKLANKRLIYHKSIGTYMSKISDLLNGFKNINYATKNNIMNEQNKSLEDMEDKRLKFGTFRAFTNVLNGSSLDLIHISAFATVGILLAFAKITIGSATAALAYMGEFIDPLSCIIGNINDMKSSKEVRKKVIDFISRPPAILNEKIQKFDKSITFEDVSIKYDDFTLDNFSFTFEKGKKYALIGHSGSGKSTIINLLMKYANPDNGKIIIDGVDIKNKDTSDIMCCINQNEYIFSANFKDNVTIYDSYTDIPIDNVLNYLDCPKIATITDKDNCKDLSGGEKQLLATVRMMLMNKDIILLDEPFSALDKANTILINDKIFNIKNKTIIVVTHNVSDENLKYFDTIISMDNGKIKQLTR